MRKKYILLCILFLIFFATITMDKKEQKEGEQLKVRKVGGLIATWEYVDREVTLSYFYNLDNSKTYGQILDEIGKPNGYRGSGIVLPYYQVGDNYVVIAFSRDENGEYDKVAMVYLYTCDEVIERIYPR